MIQNALIRLSFGFLLILPTQSFAQVSLSSVQQISVGANSTVPSGTSGAPTMAINGRILAFNSNASNLVSNDSNVVKDVFATDLTTGVTSLMSISTSGKVGDAESANPALSPIAPDGFYILAFESLASNLSSFIDTGNRRDIFIRIPTLGITELVSQGVGQTPTNGNSRSPSVTGVPLPNRILVAFESDASNLVAGDSNRLTDIFLATLSISGTTQVTLSSLVKITGSATAQANGNSEKPKLSGDGAYIVFTSSASNLISGTTTTGRQIYLYEVATGITTLVSKNGQGAFGIGDSYNPSISFNGKRIAYITEASSLVVGASTSAAAAALYDASTQSTVRVNSDETSLAGNGSVNSVQISASGRFITFSDSSTNLIADDTNGVADVYVKDLMTAQVSRVSVGQSGSQTNSDSDLPAVAGTGYTTRTNTVFFRSFATNLTSSNLSSGSDVYAVNAVAPLQTLTRQVKLEVPPDVTVTGGSVRVTAENFKVVQGLTSKATTSNKKVSKRYDIRVKSTDEGRNFSKRSISKRNVLTQRNLKPGNYNVRYRVQTVKGTKAVRATPFSPFQNFTIVN